MTLDKPPLCALFLRIRSKDMKGFLQSGFEGPLQGVVKKKKKGELCFFLTCLSGALQPPWGLYVLYVQGHKQAQWI